MISKITINGKNIIVTETNRIISLRLKKTSLSSKYLIEDHFGNYLGFVGVSKMFDEKIFVEDREHDKILFTKDFVEWSFTIPGKRKKKIAAGTTTDIIFSKDTFGIHREKP